MSAIRIQKKPIKQRSAAPAGPLWQTVDGGWVGSVGSEVGGGGSSEEPARYDKSM